MEADTNVRERIARLWAAAARLHGRPFGLPPPALVGVVTLALAVPLIVMLQPGGPAYHRLFSMVKDRADIAAVAEVLERHSIPCLISDGGRTISAPRDRLEEAWRHVAQGRLIPRRYERIESDLFGRSAAADLSPESLRMRRQRARELELSQTIADFDGVAFARVHITEHPATLFRGEERAPTASVVLGLASEHRMGPGQVRSIVQVVCHAVPGLTPEHVTIADRAGHAYDGTKALSEPPASPGELEEARVVEASVVAKVREHLWPIFGPENCATSATVDLVPRSDEWRPVALASAIPTAGGVLAAVRLGAERPTAPPPVRTAALGSAAAGPIERRPMTIRRLSVSILINARSLPRQRLAPSLKGAIEEEIKTAVGFQPVRGDRLSIIAAPFRTVPEAPRSHESGFVMALARHFNAYWLSQIAVLTAILMWLLRSGFALGPAGAMECPVPLADALARAPGRARGIEDRIRSIPRESLRDSLARQSDEDLAIVLAGVPGGLREHLLAAAPPDRVARLEAMLAIGGPVPLGRVEQGLWSIEAMASLSRLAPAKRPHGEGA